MNELRIVFCFFFRRQSNFFPREDQTNFESTVPGGYFTDSNSLSQTAPNSFKFTANDIRDDYYQNSVQPSVQTAAQSNQQRQPVSQYYAPFYNSGEYQYQSQNQYTPPAQSNYNPSSIQQQHQQQQHYSTNLQPQYSSADQQYQSQYSPSSSVYTSPSGGSYQQQPQGPFMKPPRGSYSAYQPNYPRPTPPDQSGPPGFPPQSSFYQSDQSADNPISNFLSNLQQGAASLFGPAPTSSPSYRPPPFNNQGQYRPGVGMNPNNPLGQFGKAIEEITRNDDFQCIPKVICQMVGNQRRVPSILSSPIFSS